MRRSKRGQRGGSLGLFVILIILASILVGGYFLYTSNMFERNMPKISLKDKIFWNLKTALPFKVTDDTGIKSLKIVLDDGVQQAILLDQKFEIIEKEKELSIEFPKGLMLNQNKNYKLYVEVSDISRWNFFMGNKLASEIGIVVDSKKPEVYILNQSYKITKGGSATVVFKASDDMLKDVYIETNYGKIYEVKPFYKDGYYASIVAWPVDKDDFRAYVVAIDMAGNETKTRIRYYLQDKKYKVSNIKLNNEFLDGKITDLVNIYAQNSSEIHGVDKFKFVNESLRAANEKIINEKTNSIIEDSIDEFFLKPFYPLKNAQAVASFGDHRFYSMDDKPVSESWHLGLDLASIAQADIRASNDGVVVLAKDTGIYGLSIVLYHGFGLYTIHSHCSNAVVSEGEQVKAGDIIGNTGSSGLAFGDHLHFGIIVQGVEVRPEEWMDKNWMKDNIYTILDNAKKIIDNKI
ncbi:zinc metallopeptidase, M23 family [Campylobacter blaseri]|uniref:Peptidase M23 n=1 Tax=Campylobacter blaseri TaxID=2042961 RepID=A0A2P8QZB1_9BACT|nr:M23 family metallopeptidase [Campylobacter blaseri]PSM51579.1 peptidase M23 [Campylobacter blaseri]PSM53372.1 peptidase M23 [Campylobacter blaseri]QKF86667.1 zinc metallopeptidase, M23 family [Campylobacter blaseri]